MPVIPAVITNCKNCSCWRVPFHDSGISWWTRAGLLRNELAWFDRDENNSAQIAARLNADATNVRAVIGDRVAIIVQNSTLMIIAFAVGFGLQWKMTLVMLATFPLIIVCAYVDVSLTSIFLPPLSHGYLESGPRMTELKTLGNFAIAESEAYRIQPTQRNAREG